MLSNDLILDNLVRRRKKCVEVQPITVAESSHDTITVKVVILGAPGVGKTSIVEQFMSNSFSNYHVAANSKHTYYTSIVINDHIYGLKISDLPTIPFFPDSSECEWDHYRYYGLRSADAYILVFDLSDAESFQYVKAIRSQIVGSRDTRNVPLIFVGNKADLLEMPSVCGSELIGNNSGMGIENKIGIFDSENGEKIRNIVEIVKRHWKCGYIECSAKYNWHVIAVFRELMETIHATKCSDSTGPE